MEKQKIVLITPFPDKNNVHAKNTGVGSYSYYLAKSMSEYSEITVWAQKSLELVNYSDNSGTTNSIYVERVWKKGFFGIFSIIQKCILERPKIIHIQHEINMFGNELTLPFTPLIAIIPRLLGTRVVTTFHGGMGIAEIDKEYVKENGKKLPPVLIQIAFRYIFSLFSLGSNKVIVHEQFQKEQLCKEHFVASNKIEVIAHGVPSNPEIVLNAKEKLSLENKKVLLFMGFAAKYKGLPELCTAFTEYINLPENKNTVLIVGAGMAPRLQNDQEYITWYADLQNKFISLGEQVRWVGFISSEEISLYYSASDVVLFPYTRRLAASGPMAIAIGYEKNIIVSNVFAGKAGKNDSYVFDLQTTTNLTELKKERTWNAVAMHTIKVYESTTSNK
jgi:glycosyltransferase involved in cell wall biosynthesis